MQNNDLIIMDMEGAEKFLQENPAWNEYAKLIHEPKHYFTKAEIISEGIIGELIFNDPDTVHHERCVFIYFIGRSQLVIVDLNDEAKVAKRIFNVMQKEEKELTPVRLFVQLLDYTVKNEMEHLQKIESACYRLEEELVKEQHINNPTKDIAHYRKTLLNKNFRYQQLGDMMDTMCENPFDIFTDTEKISFQRFGNKMDRLSQQTQLLREYLVQIRQMYEQHIDVEHNKTMQMLTVVTTLFLPLTLLAGWYGMNFKYMPELDNKYAYFIIIVLCMILVMGELIFFKKKGLIGRSGKNVKNQYKNTKKDKSSIDEQAD